MLWWTTFYRGQATSASTAVDGDACEDDYWFVVKRSVILSDSEESRCGLALDPSLPLGVTARRGDTLALTHRLARIRSRPIPKGLEDPWRAAD
jgi:hypothetical protein